jgi:hypothetical protein
MAVHTKKILSGSTNGRPLRALGATTSGGVLIHAAGSATGDNNGDEVWLWAFNTATTPYDLTIGFGGATGTDRFVSQIPPQDGLYPVCPGLMLNGSLEVRGYTTASNVLSVVGYVNSVAT